MNKNVIKQHIPDFLRSCTLLFHVAGSTPVPGDTILFFTV
jgi:hypothetical protein